MFSQLLLKCHECLTCLAESPCRVSWNKKPEQGWLCRDLHSQPGRNTPNIPLPRELLGFFGSDLPIKRRLSLCPLRCHVTAFSSCCLLLLFFFIIIIYLNVICFLKLVALLLLLLARLDASAVTPGLNTSFAGARSAFPQPHSGAPIGDGEELLGNQGHTHPTWKAAERIYALRICSALLLYLLWQLSQNGRF